MPTLLWFRRDLRLKDLPALSAAAADDAEVLCCFVLDPRLESSAGQRRLQFLADSLRTYDGKEFRSAVDGDLGLEDEPKPQESESDKECLTFIKETLGDRVDEVKASKSSRATRCA